MIVFGGAPPSVRKTFGFHASFHMAKLSASYPIQSLPQKYLGWFFACSLASSEESSLMEDVGREDAAVLGLWELNQSSVKIYKFVMIFVQWYNWTDGILLSALVEAVAPMCSGTRRGIDFLSWDTLAKADRSLENFFLWARGIKWWGNTSIR